MPTASEIQSIRLFVKKGLIFAAPFVLYAAFLAAIDPFNYFPLGSPVDDAYKRKTAGKLHYTLWKSLEFRADPKPNLMLGDSRMALVAAREVTAMTGDPYYNFSYGGGTVPELVDTFWFASELVSLERVYIGISFINFNAFQNMNRFTESAAILENPLLYLTHRNVLRAAVLSSYMQLSGAPVEIERPPFDRDAFWQHQLGDAIAAHYGRFKYPSDYLEGLREIAAYCAEHGVELTFVIPPSHVDLQAKIAEFGHTELAARFGRDLRSVGRVIDFDFPNAFTRDRENFSDPFHFHPTRTVLDAIWSDEPDPEMTR